MIGAFLLAFLFKPCVGHEDFCEKRYNEISYLVTHNAMSSTYDRWFFPNQDQGLLEQLEDGVRGLSWDIHYDEGKVYLCHGYCWLGKRELGEDLKILKNWLEENPREIISIFFESYVLREDVEKVFEEVGLIPYLHHQEKNKEWPKTIEMITSNKRIVVFTSKDGGVTNWYHDGWMYMWDTDFSYRKTEDFTCSRHRGEKSSLNLYSLNHFLTNPLASRKLAKKANPTLYERAVKCWSEVGQRPNFIFVDFYSIEETLEAVERLNFYSLDATKR